MRQEAFEKGELFEKYVSDVLFPTHAFDLIHRTNSRAQNINRYAADTLKPDFKFRCRETNQEFYI